MSPRDERLETEFPELQRRYRQGGGAARDAHTRLAELTRSIIRRAAKQWKHGLAAGGADDLEQVGVAALAKSLKRFDSTRGAPVEAYIRIEVERAMQSERDRLSPGTTVSNYRGRQIGRGEAPAARLVPAFSEGDSKKAFERSISGSGVRGQSDSERCGRGTLGNFSFTAARTSPELLCIRKQTLRDLDAAYRARSAADQRIIDATFALVNDVAKSERELAEDLGLPKTTLHRRKHEAMREIARDVRRPVRPRRTPAVSA